MIIVFQYGILTLMSILIVNLIRETRFRKWCDFSDFIHLDSWISLQPISIVYCIVIILYKKITFRNVTYAKCYLRKTIPIRNVSIRKCTIHNVTDQKFTYKEPHKSKDEEKWSNECDENKKMAEGSVALNINKYNISLFSICSPIIQSMN